MKTFEEIEAYAAKHFVPIARKDFVEYFKNLIKENNYHEVLEIGSAIGYTTCHLALMDDVYVTTIEYNTERHNLCVENINDMNVSHKVLAIHDDALEVFISQKFDVIFIDAAKAKNIKFFEKYTACTNLTDKIHTKEKAAGLFQTGGSKRLLTTLTPM